MILTTSELHMLSLGCFTRLTQSKTRKKLTKRRCKKHAIHYFHECPLCTAEQKLLEVDL